MDMARTRRDYPGFSPGLRTGGRGGYEDRDGKVWPGLKALRKGYERRARQAARLALAAELEPEPFRPRGRARWDCF